MKKTLKLLPDKPLEPAWIAYITGDKFCELSRRRRPQVGNQGFGVVERRIMNKAHSLLEVLLAIVIMALTAALLLETYSEAIISAARAECQVAQNQKRALKEMGEDYKVKLDNRCFYCHASN